jgi:hypothetical protein
MHDTAEALERSEAILHESAERCPDAETADRLHSLGDQVTSQAKQIENRATALDAAHGEASPAGTARRPG